VIFTGTRFYFKVANCLKARSVYEHSIQMQLYYFKSTYKTNQLIFHAIKNCN